jgi:hypothetical protein
MGARAVKPSGYQMAVDFVDFASERGTSLSSQNREKGTFKDTVLLVKRPIKP